MIVYTDKDGIKYGFCSRACLDFWRHWREEPGTLHQPPDVQSESANGCWWCGADLMAGTRWLA